MATFEERAEEFRTELEQLLKKYDVELHSDVYDGSFDLYEANGRGRIYNFSFKGGNYL